MQLTGKKMASEEDQLNLIKCNSVMAKQEWHGFSALEVELLGLFWAVDDC